MLTFSKFVQWAFLGILAFGVQILWQMKESVSSLNTKIEVLVTEQSYVKATTVDHEGRIRLLEKK